MAADFTGGLMYYLGPAQVARQQTHEELYQEVQDFYRKERDPRPDAALDPKPLDQERKREKIFPKLIAKAGHLGRQLGGGVCRGQ